MCMLHYNVSGSQFVNCEPGGSQHLLLKVVESLGDTHMPVGT